MKRLTFGLLLLSMQVMAMSPTEPTQPQRQEVLKLDLPAALRLVDERNTELAVRIEKVFQSELEQNEAWYQWFPTVRAGVGYSYQDGSLQNTVGNVSDATRNARSGGLGVSGSGAGLPLYPGLSLEISLADAIYAPQIASQNLQASKAEREEIRFLKTLEVTDAYYNLLLAQQAIQLEEQSLSEAAAISKSTREFANAGEGLEADADRAAVESLLHQHQLIEARNRKESAAATLKKILNLRENVTIQTAEQSLVPLQLYKELPDADHAVAEALENRALIEALQYRLEAKQLETKRESNGIYIPKIGASYSYGLFSGGTDALSGSVGSRHDVTVALYWQLDNLSFLNRSQKQRRESEQRALQAQVEQLHTDVSTEVLVAVSDLDATTRQLEILRQGVSRARKSYELSRERIFENQGLPLEALSAFQSLTRMETLYAQTVARYNQAQFFLLMATGQFIPELDEKSLE